MANPTTYFGWVMPTSSSLVTNLPADFNTFGQGVDTSMQDLLGGTTGQVLSKTSATNMDFTWVTPTDQTPLTTKGDLFTFTTVDARLGVGTNGQVLTADSTAATGLAWATAASGSTFVGCRAYATSAQNISNGVETAMALQAETYDTTAFHDNSTNNSRITIPAGKAGYYTIMGLNTYAGSTAGQRDFYIMKNGTTSITNSVTNGQGNNIEAMMVTDVQYLNVGDYIQLYAYQDSGGTIASNSGTQRCFLLVAYMGA